MQPARDVAVTYRMLGGEGQMQLSWLTAQGLQRMDMPGGQGWMVVDTRTSRGFMVMQAQRMVMDMPDTRGQAAGQFGRLSETAQVSREGSATVAGTPCTIWRFADQGHESHACLTADGVMLRVVGRDPNNPGRETGMEATQVNFAAQDPARFARPAGYQSMQMPAMPNGMQGGMQGGGRPPGR